jgi:hypothetical protein
VVKEYEKGERERVRRKRDARGTVSRRKREGKPTT